MWMLDTNICISLIKLRPPHLLRRVRALSAGELVVSSITVAELEYGVANSQRPEENRYALGTFLAPLFVDPFDDEAASAYGRVRVELERAGTPIGANDLLLAAQALDRQYTFVTNNTREFRRVAGLRVEDWLMD